MKKSNITIFAVLALVSAFLLWLWYFLGLNVIDEPLDLVLSIVWWVVIAVAIVAIVKMEQIRRRRVRTVYVGDCTTFNSEKGLAIFDSTIPMEDVIAGILKNLKYDFTRADFPEKDRFEVKYFVRTREFADEKADEVTPVQQDADAATEATDASASAQEQPTDEPKKWTGEVVIVGSKEERPFESSEELASILESLDGRAA